MRMQVRPSRISRLLIGPVGKNRFTKSWMKAMIETLLVCWYFQETGGGRGGRSRDGTASLLDSWSLELADLVAQPGRLFVILEGHRELELLLESLQRAGRPLLLDL